MHLASDLGEIVNNAVACIAAKIVEETLERPPVKNPARSSNHRICAYDEAVALFQTECYRQKCAIWERNNASIRVNMLPIELFTDILLISISENKWMRDLGNLLGVSRFWRTMVQTSPRFWTKIDGSWPADIRAAFLCRSKSAPLSISLGVTPSTNFHDTFLNQVLPHTARVHVLRLTPWQPTAVGTTFLRSAFPILHDLHITYDGQEQGLASSNLTLSNSTPELQFLTLSTIPLHWKPALIPKLRYLALLNFKTPPSVPAFMELLSCLPLLESLALHGWDVENGHWHGDEEYEVLPPVIEEWPTPEQLARVHLPRLEDLTIQDVPRAITQAIVSTLEALKYHRFTLDDTPLHCLSAFSASLSSLLQACESVDIRMRDYNKMVLDVSTPYDYLARSKLSLKIKTSPSRSMEDIERLLHVLADVSPTTAIRLQVGHVHSSDDRGHSTRSWKLELTGSILDYCPGLTSLWVGQCVNMDDALEYLATPKQDGSGAWGWPCPDLSELCIQQWQGDKERFCHLRKVRWEVPGTGVGIHGLPRRRLKSFQPPRYERTDGHFQSCIGSAMKDCYEFERDWEYVPF